jgi:hypothetical protein
VIYLMVKVVKAMYMSEIEYGGVNLNDCGLLTCISRGNID